MAGKRILDAAALFNASKAVAQKHIALRSHQLDVYNKTSTLAKAVKDQTDRVTLMAQAASALAQRFNTSSTPDIRSGLGNTSIPTTESTKSSPAEPEREEGLDQDHHCEASTKNTVRGPVPKESLPVTQEKVNRCPTPDGSIPPDSNISIPKRDRDVFSRRPTNETAKDPLIGQDNRTENTIKPKSSTSSTFAKPKSQSSLSPQRAKELQRQSEFQIPSQTAGESPFSDSHTMLSGDQDKDVFYDRLGNSSSVLSALPRVKLPKHTESSQESDEHVEDGSINSELYYSSKSESQETAIPRHEAIPEQEQDEEVNTDVFHSPRIAKMLTGKEKKPSKGLEMTAASQGSLYKSNLGQALNAVETYPVSEHQELRRKPQSNSSKTRTTEYSVRRLVADLAKDTDAVNTSSKVSNISAQPYKHADVLTDVSQIPPEVAADPVNSPYEMQESRVPSSRLGRLWQYGGLATSMAFGAVGEGFRRVTGGESEGSIMLSAANMDRLVAKLSRMRGAALKLGQMMSFQGMLSH
jgi:aarF domain-containing kinase